MRNTFGSSHHFREPLRHNGHTSFRKDSKCHYCHVLWTIFGIICNGGQIARMSALMTVVVAFILVRRIPFTNQNIYNTMYGIFHYAMHLLAFGRKTKNAAYFTPAIVDIDLPFGMVFDASMLTEI